MLKCLIKNRFKITPVRFSTECPTTYELVYQFLNFTERPNVQMQLTPESNWYNLDGKSLDGTFRLGVGEHLILTVFPKKYIYLKSLGKCQDHFEYNELWLYKFVEQVRQKCTTPCFPLDKDKFSKKWQNIVKGLPECQNTTENPCFDRAFKKAQPDVNSKSCTRMHYKTVHTITVGNNHINACICVGSIWWL